MPTQTIYWETFAGLIPIKALELDDHTLTFKLLSSRGAYKAGETISDHVHYVVIKTRVSNGIQFVRTIGSQHIQGILNKDLERC